MKNIIIAVLVVVVTGAGGVFLFKKIEQVRIQNTISSIPIATSSVVVKPQTSKSIADDGVSSIFAHVGDSPSAMAFDNLGNLYVADLDSGEVSKITAKGVVTHFAAVGRNPSAIVFDDFGNLYTANRGDGTVSKIAPSGAVTTFAKVDESPHAMAFDRSGNLYTANYHTISMITPHGAVTTFAVVKNVPTALAFSSSGGLYVADYSSISKITPQGTITTFATVGVGHSSGPQGIAFDASGNLFIANGDYYDNRNGGTITMVTPGGAVTTFANLGKDFVPVAVIFDKFGNLYTANYHVSATMKVAVPNEIHTIGKFTPDGVAATFPVSFGSYPNAFAFDASSGNLYFSSPGGDIFKLISGMAPGFETGTNLSTGVFGSGSSASVGLVHEITPFVTVGNFLRAIAFDGSGSLYVANAIINKAVNIGSGIISKISAHGGITNFMSADGLVGDGRGYLIGPETIATDASGSLYIAFNTDAQYGDSTIRKITPQGIVTTFATFKYGTPVAIAFNKAGDLYVVRDSMEGDAHNSDIDMVSPSGVVTNFKMSGGPYPRFGLDTANIGAITIDSVGNLYVAGFNIINKITPKGAVAPFATVNTRPRSMAFDATGNLYVAELNIISKITPSGSVIPFTSKDPSVSTDFFINPSGSYASLAFDASGNLYVANDKGFIGRVGSLYPSGTFTSAIINTEAKSAFTTLAYATTLNGQTITMDARAGNTAVPDSSWTAWQKNVANGGDILALSGNQYFQYRANFSTTDKNITPTLDSVTVNFTNAIPN